VGGKGVLAKDLVAAGNDPVGQGRFLDVADAVDFGGDQVAGLGHVLGGLGVARRQRRRAAGGEKSEANCTAAKTAAKSNQTASVEGAKERERVGVFFISILAARGA
jgi:hypothetical protein